MMIRILKNISNFFFLLLTLFFVISPKAYSSTDSLFFLAYPGDEILSCGGTIKKTVKNNKKVKIIFFDGCLKGNKNLSLFLKDNKNAIPLKYPFLGQGLEDRILKIINILGVKTEDILFLGYPETGISLLESKYFENKLVSKKKYQEENSVYTRENRIIKDIKDVLREFQPKRIYLPHILDADKYRQENARYIYLALEALYQEGKENWIRYLEVFSYLIDAPEENLNQGTIICPDNGKLISDRPYNFSQRNEFREDISEFKLFKREALNIYFSEETIDKQKNFWQLFLKEYELFWILPQDKKKFLKQIRDEWRSIAKSMVEYGYNVNFAPVADVAYDIEDRKIDLIKKERSYSQDPSFVFSLASSAINGMKDSGIIPVVKHFPGLGRSYKDTHNWLPEIRAKKKDLYNKDIWPFRKLIKIHNDSFWIMMNHVIYPHLDKEPASLSRVIQTNILREKLGFNGIIVVDEILCMKAIKEYARINNINDPYVGEISVKAFIAGADMVIAYTYPDEAGKNISAIINAVKKAIEEGRISEEDIDISVERILKAKERTFQLPLISLLQQMSIEEKICQKIIMDTFKYSEVFEKYNLGGLHIRNRNIILDFRDISKIPIFMITQHEGGFIKDSQLNHNTRSAYLLGKELELLTAKAGGNIDLAVEKKVQPYHNESVQFISTFYQLTQEEQENIIITLLQSFDKLITSLSQMERKSYAIPHPNVITPLIIYPNVKPYLLPFEDLPIDWIRLFPNHEMSWCAYGLLEEEYKNWVKKYKVQLQLNFEYSMNSLKSLKERISKVEIKEDRSKVRVLCLAAHPDDEDNESLVYFKKVFNCSTYILCATRGEGGENFINSSLGKELGFLRSEELESAASILGVKNVYHLGKKDFGYCKNFKEALKEWGEEDTLKKIVYFYRLIKPHIIVTRHGRDKGHCHHQALRILSEKAFDLAGNSKKYPEMIKEGLLPWQPLKFFERIPSNIGENVFAIDISQAVTSDNKTIYDVGKEALKEHRSQGDWENWRGKPENPKRFYRLIKSTLPVLNEKNLFFEGIYSNNNQLDNRGIKFSGMFGVKIFEGIKIGLVENNDDTLRVALNTLGYDFRILDENFLQQGDLSQFDTIIIGKNIGMFLSQDDRQKNRFLQFMEQGGGLVVIRFLQFNQPIFSLAPYPFKSHFNPISDENAIINILEPEHILFNSPNKIETRDFNGWVQERGLTYPFKYSQDYIELTSCVSSSGELIKSGYLAADYGKGSFIYTSYSWHRQLREFHLGTYKNLVNMLSYGILKNDKN